MTHRFFMPGTTAEQMIRGEGLMRVRLKKHINESFGGRSRKKERVIVILPVPEIMQGENFPRRIIEYLEHYLTEDSTLVHYSMPLVEPWSWHSLKYLRLAALFQRKLKRDGIRRRWKAIDKNDLPWGVRRVDYYRKLREDPKKHADFLREAIHLVKPFALRDHNVALEAEFGLALSGALQSPWIIDEAKFHLDHIRASVRHHSTTVYVVNIAVAMILVSWLTRDHGYEAVSNPWKI